MKKTILFLSVFLMFFVAAIPLAGQWAKSFHFNERDIAYAIAQTSDAGCILAGSSALATLEGQKAILIKLNPNGDIEWRKAFQVDTSLALQQSSDGGYALAGSYESGIFILKLSSLGAVEWQKGFKAPQKSTLMFYGSEVAGLCQTRDNGFVVASQNGHNFSQGNFWVVKVDSQGALAWERAFQGSWEDTAFCLRRTFDDCLLLAGSTMAFNLKGRQGFYPDMMVMKSFPQGDLNDICDLVVEVGNEILEPNIASLEANFQPQNSSAGLFPVDITIENPNAEVHDFCSGKFLLSIKSGGGGTAEPAPGLHPYDPGSKVSITAVPSEGYKFDRRWIDGTSSSSNSISVIMDSHRQVDAFFTSTSSGWDLDIGPKGCFIATAAYKSPLHPAVQLLRDKRLLTNGPGRAFVSLYYRWSPAIARIISRSSPLRLVVRILLLPIIGAAAIILRIGWSAGLAVWLVSLAIALKKIRLIRRIR